MSWRCSAKLYFLPASNWLGQFLGQDEQTTENQYSVGQVHIVQGITSAMIKGTVNLFDQNLRFFYFLTGWSGMVLFQTTFWWSSYSFICCKDGQENNLASFEAFTRIWNPTKQTSNLINNYEKKVLKVSPCSTMQLFKFNRT